MLSGYKTTKRQKYVHIFNKIKKTFFFFKGNIFTIYNTMMISIIGKLDGSIQLTTLFL